MDLNLVALAAVAAAAVAGGLLFRHYLKAADRAPCGPVCLRCNTAAAALTSFICPGCGADVRDAGLGERRGASPARPFWSGVGYTCAFLLAALFLSAAVMSGLPRVQARTGYRSMRPASPQIQAVELFVETREADGPRAQVGRAGRSGLPAGTLGGDLYGTASVVSLEVRLPEGRWRMLDLAGKEVEAGDALDAPVIYRWMERGGADLSAPEAKSDAGHIARAIEELSGQKVKMPPSLSLSFSSSGGGQSASRADDRALPTLVIVLAVMWAGGLWLVLASAVGAVAPPGPDVHGSAAAPAGSGGGEA